MDSWSRTLSSAIALGAVALLAACSAHGADGDASPPNTPAPLASEDPYRVVPEPGRTIEAVPPADAGDIAGWVVAVVVPNDDAATQTLRAAAREVGERAGARTLEFVADGGGAGIDAAFEEALAAEADVVIGLGDATSDVFSYLTSQWLDQQFLIVGAQLPEPTANVTAVIWPGATSRGSGAPADGELDAAGTTAARAAEAVAAGLDAVADGTTGVVLSLAG